MSKTVDQLDAEVQALKLEVAKLQEVVKSLLPQLLRAPGGNYGPLPSPETFPVILDRRQDRPVDPLAPSWWDEHLPNYVIPPHLLPPPLKQG